MPIEFNKDTLKIPEERIDELADKTIRVWLDPKKIGKPLDVYRSKIDPYNLRVISEMGIRICMDDDNKVHIVLQNDSEEPKNYVIENTEDAKDIAGQFVADVLDEKLPEYTA